MLEPAQGSAKSHSPPTRPAPPLARRGAPIDRGRDRSGGEEEGGEGGHPRGGHRGERTPRQPLLPLGPTEAKAATVPGVGVTPPAAPTASPTFPRLLPPKDALVPPPTATGTASAGSNGRARPPRALRGLPIADPLSPPPPKSKVQPPWHCWSKTMFNWRRRRHGLRRRHRVPQPKPAHAGSRPGGRAEPAPAQPGTPTPRGSARTPASSPARPGSAGAHRGLPWEQKGWGRGDRSYARFYRLMAVPEPRSPGEGLPPAPQHWGLPLRPAWWHPGLGTPGSPLSPSQQPGDRGALAAARGAPPQHLHHPARLEGSGGTPAPRAGEGASTHGRGASSCLPEPPGGDRANRTTLISSPGSSPHLFLPLVFPWPNLT